MKRDSIHNKLDDVIESLVAKGFSYRSAESLILKALYIVERKGIIAKENNATLHITYAIVPNEK